MKGRRLPYNAAMDGATFPTPTEPGDYVGPIQHPNEGGNGSVYFLLPTARDEQVKHPGERSVHRVASPPHTFRECEDGSLEIRASIACKDIPTGENYWHGFLDEGHEWRQV